MRVYKFLNAKFGVEALEFCRLKVSRIGDLNDPFELLGVNLSDRELRTAFIAMKNALAEDRGLLCFSKRWWNPVLWSHYADSHRGLCLGFDVPDNLLIKVSYTTKRAAPATLSSNQQTVKERAMKKILATKFQHWSYEEEVRLFVGLEDKDRRSEHYFFDFSDQLKLAKIIVGAESAISRRELAAVLGEQNAHIERLKARPAFTSFSVVRNKDESLWR